MGQSHQFPSTLIWQPVFACGRTAECVRAVDLDKLSSMNETKRPADIELKGRELEAIDVAFRQFRQDQFSLSGDLSIHYRDHTRPW